MQDTLTRVTFILACLLGIHGDILSHNGKYFGNVGPKKITGNRAESLVQLDVNFRSSKARHRRSVTPLGHIPDDLQIAVSKFVLNNTENSDHVFAHWAGHNNRSAASESKLFILAITYNFSHGQFSVDDSMLWCSEDYGETFNIRRFSKATKLSFMYSFPSNPKKLLFVDVGNRMIYTTDDELLHNTSHSVQVDPELIVPHPSNDRKLLLYSYTEQKLFVSVDFAATWTLIGEQVVAPFYWGDPDYDVSEDVVHMHIEGEIPSQAVYKSCLIPDCKSVPGDLDLVGPFVAESLRLYKEYMFVQKENHNGSDSHLMVSFKRGPFRRAHFPSNEKTRNFMILNLDDNQVFVAVHHGDVVNLYLSDISGQYYVLSLADVYHQERLDWFEIDFTEVRGTKWTFMANKVQKSGSNPISFIQTYISYDKGGNWAPLFINKTCTKAKDCALLLEVKDSYEVDPLRSIETAPGVILTHGLLGLSNTDRFMSVFVSNDGGATWKQAPLNTTCYLKILDQGSVLTAIPDKIGSKLIYYSLDQGNTWKNQTLDGNGLGVEWVATEPGQNSLIESVLGHESLADPWTYMRLNLSTLFTRSCTEDDFELWSPKDYNMNGATKNCILGRVVQYRRRKPKALCRVDQVEAPHILNSSACVCTQEDYECDFGYERKGKGCEKAKWFDNSYVPAECDNGGQYHQSQGYRKIPADNCTEDEADMAKYDRKLVACPSVAPSYLSLMAQVKTASVGKQIFFYLEQARGSKWNTTYSWDFGDGSETVVDNSTHVQHTYHKAGIFHVTATAQNKEGMAKATTEIRVQDRVSRIELCAPWAAVAGLKVTLSALPMSSSQLFPTAMNSIHFMWSFGDENPKQLPVLTWNTSVSHTYSQAGTYNIRVEAANSISSVVEEIPIRIFDEAVIVEIKFDEFLRLQGLRNPIIASLITQSLRQQIAQDLGLNLDRLEAMLEDDNKAARLYLFPTERSGELSSSEIKDRIIDQTKDGKLGFDLFGTHLNKKNLIKIVSAKEVKGDTDDGKKSGPNLIPVYVAAPVLFVLLVSCTVAVVIYCRRKRNGGSGTRYNLFANQDDADAMLDDEDVAPLNMNLEFSAAQGTRDDSLLDSGWI